jgi:hypothetical protein
MVTRPLTRPDRNRQERHCRLPSEGRHLSRLQGERTQEAATGGEADQHGGGRQERRRLDAQ